MHCARNVYVEEFQIPSEDVEQVLVRDKALDRVIDRCLRALLACR